MLTPLLGILESVSATIVAALFLLLDFAPHIAEKLGKETLALDFLPFAPSWVTIIICGIPVVKRAVMRACQSKGIRRISSPLLITIAMVAAIAIGDLFAAGEIAWIMAIGRILEAKTVARAQKGLKKLVSLAPTQGRRIVNGQEETIPAETIREGDVIRILPGETIAVDGVILNGETSVDQSIMTGESLPVEKGVNDKVYSGTLNLYGAIEIRATQVGKDSSLQKLIQLVVEAKNKKAPMARIADLAASWLVPTALVVAIITGCITNDIVRAVTILVVFCPCSLVLATPTAIMAAIGQATKRGVIIKSGEALEKMGLVDTIALDKTGTLTEGRLEVSDVVSWDSTLDEDALLSLVASAETKSEHPIGKAIIARAKSRNLPIQDSEVFRMTSGKGIYAEIGSRKLICGNEKYLSEYGISLKDKQQEEVAKLRSEGKACVLAADNEKVLGVLATSDVIRPEAKGMIDRLRKMGSELVLLTGDNVKTANYFAQQLGLANVHAQLLPEEKVEKITSMQQAGKAVCMLGDGVNDAPALKTADVGVAMGGLGSDIAIDAADVVLMKDDISNISYLKRLSNATVKTIKFCIALSMCINVLAIILSMMGYLNPTLGALVHNAGSCFVVMIAALLYERKFQ